MARRGFEERHLHICHAAKMVYRAKGDAPRLWIGEPKRASGKRTLAIGPALASLFAAERERQEALQRELLGRDPNVTDMKSLVPPDACVFCADPATAEGLRSQRNPNTLGRQFKRAASRASLPHVTPHWLRHTAISHAIAEGTSLADASLRAGHKNPAITAAIYTHATGEGEKKAALIGDSQERQCRTDAELGQTIRDTIRDIWGHGARMSRDQIS
jgi:integrase